MERSDQQLVAHYLETRDARVFEQLVARYLKLIYTIAVRISHQVEDAQDISQDVFVKVWKHLDRYDPKQSFKPWIAQIAKNTALDWMKKKKPLLFSGLDQEEELFIDQLVDAQPLPSDIFAQTQEAHELEQTIQQLPAHYAEVIQLRYREGLTFQEIADRLEMIMDTVKTRHRRGLQMMKKLLGKTHFDEPK